MPSLKILAVVHRDHFLPTNAERMGQDSRGHSDTRDPYLKH